MRLQAVAKAGFYPAAPEAIGELLKHLTLPDRKPEECFILDPCAGEGTAIGQIADTLGIPYEKVYCVELDGARSAAIRERMPGVNLLGPASFLGISCTGYVFSLAYVNPPFDNEMGGGKREECRFIEQATRKLVLGGVLVAVMPYSTLAGKDEISGFLDRHYEDIEVYKFPDGSRPFSEIAIIAKRRMVDLSEDGARSHGELHKKQVRFWWQTAPGVDNLAALGEPQFTHWYNGKPSASRAEDLQVWTLKPGARPHTWKQTAYTDEELRAKVEESPLHGLFSEVLPMPRKRPPLPLARGHVALLLAAGELDGLVEEGDGRFHVVRGTARKEEYQNKEASKEEQNPENGATKTVDVFSQRIVLTIRAVGEDGVIRDFNDNPKKDEEEAKDLLVEKAVDQVVGVIGPDGLKPIRTPKIYGACKPFADIILAHGGLDALEQKAISIPPRDGLMRLCIEDIGNPLLGYRRISVAHYYEQNGDLCQDPEMVFLVPDDSNIGKDWREGEGWIPKSFYMANMPISETKGDPAKEKDQLVFAQTWGRNVKEQGFLEHMLACRKPEVAEPMIPLILTEDGELDPVDEPAAEFALDPSSFQVATPSFKVGVKTNGDTDWCSNGIRFARREDAERAGADLFSRWTAVKEWTVLESTDAPNK